MTPGRARPTRSGVAVTAALSCRHHRIIIVMPKEVPHHVNHVHMYKLADKGIPLIHSGKVVHDHKHSGKVAHEHGHAGLFGHQHKHAGLLSHKHASGKGAGGGGGGKQYYHQPLLRTAAHRLNVHQQQLQYLHGGRGRPASSGQVQFVPSSKPHGLGSFMPAEIQQYVVNGRHGALAHKQYEQQEQYQQHQQQQYFDPDAALAAEDVADEEDESSGGDQGSNPPAPFNLIQLRVPDHHQSGPNVIKHVDIDLTNNVAKLNAGNKQQQPVTANFKVGQAFRCAHNKYHLTVHRPLNRSFFHR